jgi:hypothetical protein
MRQAAGGYLINMGLLFKLIDLMKRVGLATPSWRAKKRRTLRVLFQQDRAVVAFCSAMTMVGVTIARFNNGVFQKAANIY